MSDLQTTSQKQILLFTLDEPRYALNLSAVERVVRAVEITPLPSAPASVLGVINVQGQIIPVMDIRQRLNLPQRELDVSDHFILVRTERRRVAIVVDSAAGTRNLTEREYVNSEQILPGAGIINGLVKLEDNLLLICDLDRFLSFDEERKLESALINVTATEPEARRLTEDTA